MLKFFRVAFGLSGTRTPVPDAADPSGLVSYIEGYGPDYQRAKTDPLSKNIERDKMNQLFFDATTAIGELQGQGVPDFITTALNGGTPFNYAKNSLVRWTDGEVYASIVATNTTPADTTKWAKLPVALLGQTVNADPGRKYRALAFVARNAAGTWAYINDADHAPIGMSAISVVDLGGGVKVLRTTYDPAVGVSRVLTMVGSNDETLSSRGLAFGPSVGLTFADWRFYMPFSAWIDKNAGVYTFGNIDPWLGPGEDSTIALTAGIADGSSITITHGIGSGDDPPVACAVRGNARSSLDVVVAYGGTTTRLDFVEDLHGYVAWTGPGQNDWTVQTPNSNKPTFAFAAGILTVTHEDIGDIYDVELTGVGGVLLVAQGTPSGSAATRSTSFLVTFQDYAGVNQTVANANFKFTYRRARKVRTVPPDGTRVSVRRGPVILDPAKVISTDGNIWVSALMEVA